MTKSYNYIPTHFLYSPLLFFLLIFMHQLIHCHTLLQPFSKIFLFRIYVPTTYTPAMLDFDLDETSVSGFHKHTRQTAPANQSTNDTVHTLQISHTHSTNTTTIQPPQTHTAPQTHNDTNAHSTPARPPTQTLTPSHREAMPYPDVDAQPASSGLTVRPSGRTRRSPVRSSTSQSDRPGRRDQIEP